MVLRSARSKTPTGILPLSRIRSAVIFVDAQEADCDKCKDSILEFFRNNGIAGDIFYLDMRDIDKDERLLTAAGSTLLKRDLNWYGKPSQASISMMQARQPDLMVSLVPDGSFAIDYLCRSCEAKFKIGRSQDAYSTFDIVLDGASGCTQTETFARIRAILAKIR